MGLRQVLGHEGQTNPIYRGRDHEFEIVDNQGSVYCDGQCLLSFLELPAVQTGGPVPEVDAPMAYQVRR